MVETWDDMPAPTVVLAQENCACTAANAFN
jgi:hypothetical protein